MKNRFSSFIKPDLLEGSILKSLIFFTLPIFVSMLFQHLYNAVDTIIVGNYLDDTSLAAIGASASIFELIVGFGNGFGNGMGLVAARAFGSGDRDRIKKAVAGSLILTLTVSAFVALLSLFGMKPLLHLLNTPDSILDESFSYISVVSVLCIVMFAYNLCSGMLRAIGNSFTPLIFLICSSLMNIGLDILFITKFNMGIRGAAWATIIAQAISVMLCLIYIFVKARILIPSAKAGHFRFDGSLYRELFGQGISMALMSSIVSSGTVLLQSAINSFGPIIIAGHVATRKIFGISNIPLFCLGMANATFVSQNYGAQKFNRIKKGILISCAATTAWTVLVCIAAPFVIRPALRLFSGSENSQLLEYGTKYLYFCFPFYVILGFLVISRNSLQGLGAKFLPLVSSIIELLGKVLFTLLIIPTMNSTWGVILCEPLIWIFMAIYLVFALIARYKKVSTIKT